MKDDKIYCRTQNEISSHHTKSNMFRPLLSSFKPAAVNSVRGVRSLSILRTGHLPQLRPSLTRVSVRKTFSTGGRPQYAEGINPTLAIAIGAGISIGTFYLLERVFNHVSTSSANY